MSIEFYFAIGGAIFAFSVFSLMWVLYREAKRNTNTQYWNIIKDQILSDKFYVPPKTPQEVTNLQMATTALVNILRQNQIAWSITSQYVIACLKQQQQEQQDSEDRPQGTPIPMRRPSSRVGEMGNGTGLGKLD